MTTTPPRQYVVRRPSGDPAAARRLAAGFDELAAVIRAQVAAVVRVLDQLEAAWTGAGASAARSPEQALAADAAALARALARAADDLRGYAHRLEHAHEHHGWSIGRLVAMGAMVTVGVAAVVVTVGAAAPAEAAAAAAVVESAEAATAAASAAGTGAAGGLAAWGSVFGAVRPLAGFVAPHLVSAASSVGIEGVSELIGSHRLDAASLGVAAGVGFTGSSVAGVVEDRLASSSATWRRIGEGATYAAASTVGQYADRGDIDPADSAASGATGVVGRDLRRVSEELLHRLRR